MKLERLPEYVITAVATLIGIGLSLYCGNLVGQGRYGLVFTMFAAGSGLILLLTMRQRIWMLIPILWAFPGQIPLLILPFSVRHLTVMFVVGAMAVLIALKVVRRKAKYELLDFLTWANLVYLATAFIRNPVGTVAMGSDRVGGRPYFDTAVAFLAYLVLVRATMTPNQARRLPFLVFFGILGQSLIEAITYFSPSLAFKIQNIYTAVSAEALVEQDYRTQMQGDGWRHGYLASVTSYWSALVCGWLRPMTLINPVYFIRFAGFGLLVLLIFFSGFRSSLLALGFYFVVSTYIRRGLFDVFRAGALGLALIAVLVVLQGTFIQLPASAQRALSFLPGKWDPAVLNDAQHSTEWRITMWKEMLFTDRYIQSKFFGDGFGFSLREYHIQQSMQAASSGDMQDYFMITGLVHSGPISSIRYVGVVGLILYTWLMGLMALHSFRLIRRIQGTPLFEPVLIFCLPIIYAPVGYFVVYGAFDANLPQTLLYVGLLKVLTNTVDDYESEMREVPVRSRFVPLSKRERPVTIGLPRRATLR